VLVETIRPLDLKLKLDAGGPLVLLDVREENEREWCVIGSTGGVLDLHIPMSQIPLRIADLAGERGPIVVYCHHGVRSMAVARWLTERGVVGLLNLEGGIDAWSREIDASVARY
jgi:rhodanese-related sulfurtransferase